MKKQLYTLLAIAIFGSTTAQNNLGVDQTNPQAKVHVTNTTNQKSLLIEDEANDATPFVIDSVGNVGVQTTTPTTDLDVNGGIQADSIQLTNGASDGAVLQSDAVGNASWVAPEMAIYVDKKLYNVTSGTGTSGTWHTRELNTTLYPSVPTPSISRAGNVITLQPGSYYITASAPAFVVQQHQLVIRDGSNNIVLYGTTEYLSVSNSIQSRSFVEGVLVVSGVPMDITLSHYLEIGGNNSNMGHPGVSNLADNIFSTITIKKLN